MQKEILAELNSISPFLARMGKIDDGFKTPDGYFDRMTDIVMLQIDVEMSNELSSISPFLAKMGQVDDGFKVPEHYFERMTYSVLAQVELERQPRSLKQKESPWALVKARVNGLFASSGNYARLAFGIVALVVVSALALLVGHQNDTSQGTGAAITTTTDDIHKYIANNFDELDEDILIDKQLDRTAPSETAKDVKKSNSFKTKTGKDDLEQSLKEELLEEDQLSGKL